MPNEDAVLDRIITDLLASPYVPPKRGYYLYFDIETIPDETRAAQFGLNPLPEAQTETPADKLPDPATLLSRGVEDITKALAEVWPPLDWMAKLAATENASAKPRKTVLSAIAAKADARVNETANIAVAAAERSKLLSVTPEFCRIVALSWATDGNPAQATIVGDPEHLHLVGEEPAPVTEAMILERFWRMAAVSSVLVGFNVLHFDLPTIFIRSAVLGVTPTKRIDMKPWGKDVCDLMALRYPKGGQKPLKDLARILGFEVPAGDDDGSKVGEMFANDHERLRRYAASDVEITRKLHRFYKGFWC